MTPQQLQAILTSMDMAAAELAELLGMHRATVYRWLSGEVPISKPIAQLIRRLEMERATPRATNARRGPRQRSSVRGKRSQ